MSKFKYIKNIIKIFLVGLWEFFYKKVEHDLDSLTESEYKKIFFEGRSKEEIRDTYEKAWESKNFEIQNYWKRSNYFWAFQVASFTGYFAVLSSDFYKSNPQVLYGVIGIGIISSLAWTLLNTGSKTWQRHWENQVDMLEDKITGPLYKVSTISSTYSVSKMNDIVSRFITVIWFVLAIKYFLDNITFIKSDTTEIDFIVIIITFFLAYFIGAMFFGHGRGRFSRKEIELYKRKTNIKNPS